MKQISKKIILGIAILALAGIGIGYFYHHAKSSAPKKIEIIETVVGGRKLYIPDVYLNFGYTSAGEKSALLQAYYPGSNPVPEDPQKLWENDKWWRNIRILFKKYQTPNPDAVLAGQIDLAKAFKEVGEVYNLRHLTQEKEEDTWKKDIFIENDSDDVSFISCSDEQYEGQNPQCSHSFYIENFGFKISYSKKLLPEWKKIKTNVIDLFNSFQSSQTAASYVQQLLLNPDIKRERHDTN